MATYDTLQQLNWMIIRATPSFVPQNLSMSWTLSLNQNRIWVTA